MSSVDGSTCARTRALRLPAVQGQSRIPGRGSVIAGVTDLVFAGVTDFAYAPRDARLQIASGAAGRFALAGAKCER